MMKLTKENYKLVAAKLYRNPILVDSEFAQDLMLTSRIVNRMRKFSETGELKVKLLYNHYTVACNCFGTEYVNKTIFLLSDESTDALLTTMLFAFTGNMDDIVVNDQLIAKFHPSKVIETVVNKIQKELRE